LLKRARAFSPAGISSFFEICDRPPEGTLITNLERVGARGGGFVIEKGVFTEVSVTESEKPFIEVYINNKLFPEAETTNTVAAILLEEIGKPWKAIIHHKVDVPIGAGFGSSASGALSTALALSKALGINLTLMQAGKIAHIAEIRCRTGLGTVGPVSLGGCVLTIKAGAPSHAVIDRLPTSPDHRIVAGCIRPISTKETLESAELKRRVNRHGRETIQRILADPSLESFMSASKEFSKKTGFATSMTEKLIELAEEAGAIGATQNMIGEAVHALVPVENVEGVVEAFSRVLPSEQIINTGIDTQGARIIR